MTFFIRNVLVVIKTIAKSLTVRSGCTYAHIWYTFRYAHICIVFAIIVIVSYAIIIHITLAYFSHVQNAKALTANKYKNDNTR